jgi:hypothetical protein
VFVLLLLLFQSKKKKQNNFGEKKATLSRPHFLFSFAPLSFCPVEFFDYFLLSSLSRLSPYCVFSILYFIGQTKTC